MNIVVERQAQKLWVLLLTPPLLWAVQLLAAWALAASMCDRADAAGPLRAVLLALGAVVLVGDLVSGGISWRAWRHLSSRDLVADDRTQMMALCAVCVAVMGLLAALLSWAPVFTFGDVCGAVR